MLHDLAAAPIRAYRSWQRVVLHNDDGVFGARLQSGYDETIWPAGEWLRAKCASGHEHDAPQLYCTCGIYATKKEAVSKSLLTGMVELGGLVVEGEHGYVASHAYPVELIASTGGCANRDEAIREMHRAPSHDKSWLDCRCILAPEKLDMDLVREAADAYGVDLVVGESEECACSIHCGGPKPEGEDNEHREAEANNRNTTTIPTPIGPIAVTVTTEDAEADKGSRWRLVGKGFDRIWNAAGVFLFFYLTASLLIQVFRWLF